MAQGAAKKLQAEAAEKRAKAAEKQKELVKLAAIEYLRQGCGKGGQQKPCPGSVNGKLRKACRRHLTLKPGSRKGKCDFLPKRLRRIMLHGEQHRRHIEEQPRTRT